MSWFDVPKYQMPIFVLFVSAGVLFDGAFFLWVSLREHGLFSVAYVDETLPGSDTFLECKHKVTTILTYLADLGFFMHPDKSIFHSYTKPKQSILFEAGPNRILYYRNIEL